MIDFNFLKSQTFGDQQLESELLELFTTQSSRILSSLSSLGPAEQADKAHLLNGSARSVGAFKIAELAAGYELAKPGDRPALLKGLATAVELTSQAIGERLAELRR